MIEHGSSWRSIDATRGRRQEKVGHAIMTITIQANTFATISQRSVRRREFSAPAPDDSDLRDGNDPSNSSGIGGGIRSGESMTMPSAKSLIDISHYDLSFSFA
jgi:hypothetical protein